MNDYVYVVNITEFTLDEHLDGGNMIVFKTIESAKTYVKSLFKDFLKQNYTIDKGDDLLIYTSYYESHPDICHYRVMIHKLLVNQ